MRAISAAVVAVALGTAALGQTATKPVDGKCECGEYIEAPALCRTLPGDKREPCRKSNATWFDQCVAWQTASCTSGVLGAVAKTVTISGPSSLLPKYVGTWKGRTICPKQGSWNVMLSIVRESDGAYRARAATEGIGEFKRLTLVKDGDSVALQYSSVFKDTAYTGRLVSPDRLEGTAKIQEECTWYMTKSP